MSNKNFNIFNLLNKTDQKSENEVKSISKNNKTIISNTQKIKMIKYKTPISNKKQTAFNFNKLETLLADKYLSSSKKIIKPELRVSERSLSSIEYRNNFISALNYTIWIDGSDLTSILRGIDNKIYTILDKSGNGNHLYQPNILNQPTYHNGGIIFNNNAFLCGTNSTTLTNSNTDIFNQSINNMSIFIVIKQYNIISTEDGIISGFSSISGSDDNNSNAWSFNSSDGSTYRYSFNSDIGVNGSLYNSDDINTTMPFGLYEIIINNNTGNLYYNGNYVSTNTYTGLDNFTNFVLGARFRGIDSLNVFDTFFSGEIYEVMIIDTALSNNDRYNVEKYLMNKWITSQLPRIIPFSNVYTWLDAGLSGNFTLDDNNVLSWNDKFLKLNFIPGSSPVFDTNKVIFDGSFLTMDDSIIGLDLYNFAIFYVFETTESINSTVSLLSCIGSLLEEDDNTYSGFSLSITSDILQFWKAGNSISYSISPSTKYVIELNTNLNLNIITMYVNGTLVQSISFVEVGGTGHNFTIGVGQNSTTGYTSPLKANIYEVMILNSSATYQQRNQIYSYFNEKYPVNCIMDNPAPDMYLWLDSTVNFDPEITGWTDRQNGIVAGAYGGPPTGQTINGLNGAYFNSNNASSMILPIAYYNDFEIIDFQIYIVFSGDNTDINTQIASYTRLISFYNQYTNSDSAYAFNINAGATAAASLNNIQSTIQYNSAININTDFKYDNNLNILTVSFSSATNSINFYINNQLVKSDNSVNPMYIYYIIIGTDVNQSGYWNGYINEIIFYPFALDSDSHNGTTNYLTKKWGINSHVKVAPTSLINQYISRAPITVSNTIKLDYIYDNTINTYMKVSNSIDLSSSINISDSNPILSSSPNEISIVTSDPIYLSVVDINTIYFVKAINIDSIIYLPTLLNNGDYFAFTSVIEYSKFKPFIVKDSNNLYYEISDSDIHYFTNTDGTYSVSNTFTTYTFTLDKYDTDESNAFTVYLGGWTNNLGYITNLFIYDSNDNYITTTSDIYIGKSGYQADFSLITLLVGGTYNLIVSDVELVDGNLFYNPINTPVVVIRPTAVLDHYNNGSSTYTITLLNWTTMYESIEYLYVYISTTSNYANPTQIKITNPIQFDESNFTTTFTYDFSVGYYWITLLQNSGDVLVNIKITNPIVNHPNFVFTLYNVNNLNPVSHLNSNYRISMGLWDYVFRQNIPILYLNAYLNSDYSDTPIIIAGLNTSTIQGASSTLFYIPLTYTFDIARNYYLSMSDTIDFSGIFNIQFTNYMSKLPIIANISPSSGFLNYNNKYTITLSNNENFDLTTYILNWTIYIANNNLSQNVSTVTTTTLNTDQQLIFSYNPGSNNATSYFYVGNTNVFIPVVP